MASVLKAQRANAETRDKGKRKADEMDVDGEEAEVSLPRKKKNKQRVLLLSSRGITHRMRHFMNDLEALLPHVKKGAFYVCGCPFILLLITRLLPNRLEARLEISAPSSSRASRLE
jgi:hypothetical protein